VKSYFSGILSNFSNNEEFEHFIPVYKNLDNKEEMIQTIEFIQKEIKDVRDHLGNTEEE
jgi:hypothetical protein